MNNDGLSRTVKGTRRRARVSSAAAFLAAASVVIAVAACGSSSSSKTATKNASHAVAVTPTKVPGVASPSGAKSLKTAGLKALGHVPRGAGVASHIKGLSGIPITQAIPEISGDINQFWSNLAAKNSVQWPQVQEALVTSQPVQTPQCSGTASIAPTDPMLACLSAPSSGTPTTFFWTVPFMQQNIDTDPGRVNLTFAMSMMWSAQVQNVVGSYQALQSGSLTKGAFAQQNVCLTGVYVNSINDRRLFETGDSAAIATILNNMTGTLGISSPDVTPQQLQQAFVAGYNSGDPGTCLQSGGGGSPTTPTTPTTPTS